MLYQKLNQETKKWWFHQDLRNKGQIKEARRLERKSILERVKCLRGAVFFSIGDYGSSLYIIDKKKKFGSGHSVLSGINGDLYLEFCKALKIPWADTRGINFELKNLVLKAPMIDPEKPETIKEKLNYLKEIGVKTSL